MSIAATLDLAAAGTRTWDAVVVGAGPAGALAARELARRRLAVLLVDKAEFPRWKVCGCCLNGWTLATLGRVGLGDLANRLGAVPLSRFQLAALGRTATVGLPGGVALSRDAFDAALIDAAVQAGAQFLPGTQARLTLPSATERRLVLCQANREVVTTARLVLAADGVGGGLLAKEAHFDHRTESHSYLGAGASAPALTAGYDAGTIFMASGAGGYVGLVRLEDGRLNLAAALDPAFVKCAGGLGPAAARLLAATDLPPVAEVEGLGWRGTPLLTRRVLRPASERVLVLGDAAGYIEPFTGEGIAWALASAVAVAPLAHRACTKWELSVARQWHRVHRRLVSRHQLTCRTVALALRRPALMQVVVALLARVPWVAAPLTRYLSRDG